MTRQAGFLTALLVLLSPLLPATLAWALMLVAAAFGTSPEAIGLHQAVYLLLYLGTAGWLVSVVPT